MSDLYLKVKDVQLIETREFDAFSEEGKTVKHWLIKSDFADYDISVKVNPENPKVEVLDLDEHDEGIRKLLLSVCKMDYDSLMKVFGVGNLATIVHDHTISEIQKMYDDWKKPKVGDEVRYGSHTGIVIFLRKILGEKNALLLLESEAKTITAPIASMKKTGRHFEEATVKELGEYTGVLPFPKRSDKCHN